MDRTCSNSIVNLYYFKNILTFLSYHEVIVLKLPSRQNKRMQEIRKGFKVLHLDRRHGSTDVISFLLWKEIGRGALRYQGDEATSMLETISISATQMYINY